MKKYLLLPLALCLLLTGCASSGGKTETTAETEVVVETQIAAEAASQAPSEPAAVIYPLPDTTMENLTDAILSVSLEEGNAYVDDTGKMQMDLKIYSYDQYDMVDIAMLKVGDVIVTHYEEVEVTSLERSENGTVYINGGLENGGFDLVTEDNGIFYEKGFNDHKNWYEAGDATIRVSVDFIFTDHADLDLGEVIYYPGSFLIDEVTNYDFTPYNSTIRVENGQIVEMHRRYIP